MMDIQELPDLHFDKLRSRVKTCPCGKSNKDGKFCPYVGYEDKGYCHSCGETFLPEFSKSNNETPVRSILSPLKKEIRNSFLPVDLFKDGLQAYDKNNFVKFLQGVFGEEKTKGLIEKYFIGTSSHWSGSTVFYQIDFKGRIRGGKIMLYIPVTGKRVKEPFNHITWVHTSLKLPEYNLSQCLYGEHLLRNNSKPIALVESEKTAIISSLYFPQLTWLATGGKGNLNIKQCQALRGKTVIVFPDLKGFDDWKERSRELSDFATFIVSDYLEVRASDKDREAGLDLADFLLTLDISASDTDRNSTETQVKTPLHPVEVSPLLYTLHARAKDIREGALPKEGNPGPNQGQTTNHTATKSFVTPGSWTDDITELDLFFESVTVPPGPFLLNPYTPVKNIQSFLHANLEVARAQNGNPTYLPYLKRAMELKCYLQNQINHIFFKKNLPELLIEAQTDFLNQV